MEESNDIMLDDLEECYNFSLPLHKIHLHHLWKKHDIYECSCCVFDTPFKNIDDIIARVDTISDDVRIAYRMRYFQFINEIISRTPVFIRISNDHVLHRYYNVRLCDIEDFTEFSSVDFFIPTLGYIFLGHDDHCFLFLTDKLPIDIETRESLAKNCLYLHCSRS